MFKNLVFFPVGIASSALIALKSTQFIKANKKPLLQVPLALMTFVQMKAKAQMMSNSVSILKRMEQNKPKGLTKILIYSLRFIHLGLIFLPSILLLPLALFNRTK